MIPSIDNSDRGAVEMEALAPGGGVQMHDAPFAFDHHPCIVVPSNSSVTRARRFLYLSHFLAQLSEGSWQFCVAMFLSAVTNYQSLVLVSTYGLTTSAAVCLAGASLGRFIDTSERLYAARLFIWLENVAVIFGTALCYILLSIVDKNLCVASSPQESVSNQNSSWLQSRFNCVPADTLSIASLIGVHLFGAVARILDSAFLVAIERDWVVVISRTAAIAITSQQIGLYPDADENDQNAIFHRWLAEINVTMKQIDLGCKVAAPAVSGVLLGWLSSKGDNRGSGNPSATDLRLACVWVGAVNLAALVVEYMCTAWIYRLMPALAERNDNGEMTSPIQNKDSEIDGSTEHETDDGYSFHDTHSKAAQCCLSMMPESHKVYWGFPVAWAGFGLALLYGNPLTFGNGIMSSYLLFKGLKFEYIGTLRGIASVMGLLGTVAYHVSSQWLSLELTATWSILYELSCLGLALSSLVPENNALSIGLLVAGVSLSRIGLWVFDIAVTQMQQESIPAGSRGQVGGVQSSLNASFNLLAFGIGILFPDPSEFAVYVFVAFSSAALAAVFYVFGVYWPRQSAYARSLSEDWRESGQ